MKGAVLVNGFNLGRYWNIGPQKTLYIPGVLLKQGRNILMIIELHAASSDLMLNFKTEPDLGNPTGRN